jgi:hypothetical protein
MATRPNAHKSLTRNQISFKETDMGRQLHSSGRQHRSDTILDKARHGEELQPS